MTYVDILCLFLIGILKEMKLNNFVNQEVLVFVPHRYLKRVNFKLFSRIFSFERLSFFDNVQLYFTIKILI